MVADDNDEIALLKKLLKNAKKRVEPKPVETEGGPKFCVGTFNAISPMGLRDFPPRYRVMPLANAGPDEEAPHSILLRSHKLQNAEVPSSVRAIARCGAGTNNIPVDAMTERGIPVFNTPGANANAVKELVLCALLLSSRGIVPGIAHVQKLFAEHSDPAVVKAAVETDKKMFLGQELKGKTLGVIGLGHIGSSVAEAAVHLGMKVTGYDPAISLEAAWRLPNTVDRASSIDALLAQSDYISLHVPYIKDVTHHLIDARALGLMKKNARLVNFSRAELVDSASLRTVMDGGEFEGRYICDFADEWLHDHPNVTLMPHLGASTHEAEENSAKMAVRQIIHFIETGQIENSVNFPTTKLDRGLNTGTRLCIVNRNIPGVLGLITTRLGELGLNIIQQINSSRGDIAYNVVDLADLPSNIDQLQGELAALDGVLSSRFIEPKLEVGYFHVTPPQYKEDECGEE